MPRLTLSLPSLACLVAILGSLAALGHAILLMIQGPPAPASAERRSVRVETPPTARPRDVATTGSIAARDEGCRSDRTVEAGPVNKR